MEIFVRSELASFGPNMEGEDYAAPVFFVVAEDDMGQRWAHFHREPVAYIEDDPDGFHHVDISDQAEAKIEALANRMREFGPQYLAHRVKFTKFWQEIEPRYGSPAFMEINEFGGDGAI